MPNRERWPDRMSAADALHWSLDGVRGFRSNAGILLVFRRPLVETQIRAALLKLIERLPRMRERVVPVPFDLAPPEWVEDRSFDLDFHLQRIELPQPGDTQDLCAATAKHLATPLPRHRPPWAAISMTGLHDEHSALLLKFHYAMADGGGLARFLCALDDESAAFPQPHFSVTPRFVNPDALVWRALQYNLEEGGETVATARTVLARAVREPAVALGRVGKLAASAVAAVSDAIAPKASTSVRKARSASRRLAIQTAKLTGLQDYATRSSVSSQALLAALLSESIAALHRHPQRDVGAVDVVFPVAVRDGTMAIDLTLAAERLPLFERVQSVQRQLQAAQAEPRLLLYSLGARVAGSLPTSLLRAVGRERTAAIPAVHLPSCGPSETLRFAGRSIDGIYPFAPVLGEPPAVVVAHWYRDKLHLGVDFDPHLLPGIEELADVTMEKWSELRRSLPNLPTPN